jgi:hypothetical protein
MVRTAMDYYSASKILEEIMEETYLEEEQIEALELAIEVLHDMDSKEDDLK